MQERERERETEEWTDSIYIATYSGAWHEGVAVSEPNQQLTHRKNY